MPLGDDDVTTALVVNEVEHRWTVVIGDNGFAVDQERTDGERRDRRDGEPKARHKVIAAAGDKSHADTMPSRQNVEAVVIRESIKSPRAGGVRWRGPDMARATT